MCRDVSVCGLGMSSSAAHRINATFTDSAPVIWTFDRRLMVTSISLTVSEPSDPSTTNTSGSP